MENLKLDTRHVSLHEDRLVGIEILRFLAAIAVLTWHFQHFAYFAGKPQNFIPELQPFYAVLAPLYNSGWLGVQAFWCISGFIFFWKYADALSNRYVRGRSFAIARFARLYPLHIATLILVLGLQQLYFASTGHYFVYQENDLRHFVLQLAMASNWGFQLGDSFNGPIWSVSVEILVYVFFYLATRFLGITTWLPVAAIAIACAVAGQLRVGHQNQEHILECASCFYFGGLTALAYSYVERQRETVRRLADLIILLCGLFSAVCFLKSWGPIKLFYFPTLSLIYLCCRYIRPAVSWRSSTLETLGNLTYSSYLLHFPVQLTIVLICGWFGWTISYENKWLFIGFMFGTFCLAGLCFKQFERPMQNYLKLKFSRYRANKFRASTPTQQ